MLEHMYEDVIGGAERSSSPGGVADPGLEARFAALVADLDIPAVGPVEAAVASRGVTGSVASEDHVGYDRQLGHALDDDEPACQDDLDDDLDVEDDEVEAGLSVGAKMAAAVGRLGSTPGSSLAAAMSAAVAAVADLQTLAIDDEHVEVLGDALLAVQRLRTYADTVLLRLLTDFDAKEAAQRDGAVNTAAWLAARSNLGYGRSRDLTVAARRLGELPLFAGHLDAADIGIDHLLTVSRGMVPTRAEKVKAAEPILARLALTSPPHVLRRAIKRLADLVDPDGSDPQDDPGYGPGAHPDRELHHSRSFEGLGLVDATLHPLVAEMLTVLLDAFHTPDGADVPREQQRTPAQCRHDAFATMLSTLLAAKDLLPTVQGAHPQVSIVITLGDLLGLPGDHPLAQLRLAELADHLGVTLPGITTDPAGQTDPAGDATDGDVGVDGADVRGCPLPQAPTGGGKSGLQRAPRYGSGAPIPAAHVRDLIGDATIRAILTLGEWRPVNVGSAHRTLPAWLRIVLAAMHQHCRGPDCDRPAAWTQAAHRTPWRATYVTDLNDSLPLCAFHHKLLDERGWAVTLDRNTGICTWTAPDGRTFTTCPPRT
jgi:hypothetical protein